MAVDAFTLVDLVTETRMGFCKIHIDSILNPTNIHDRILLEFYLMVSCRADNFNDGDAVAAYFVRHFDCKSPLLWIAQKTGLGLRTIQILLQNGFPVLLKQEAEEKSAHDRKLEIHRHRIMKANERLKLAAQIQEQMLDKPKRIIIRPELHRQRPRALSHRALLKVIVDK